MITTTHSHKHWTDEGRHVSVPQGLVGLRALAGGRCGIPGDAPSISLPPRGGLEAMQAWMALGDAPARALVQRWIADQSKQSSTKRIPWIHKSTILQFLYIATSHRQNRARKAMLTLASASKE